MSAAFNERLCTGGVAVLFPPGWHVLEEIELVKGRGVAALVQDRTCKFYVISVYIHPDNRSGDMEALLRSKSRLAKAAGAETPGQMRNEKLHAAVARSTFASQNAQNTPCSDHFWKF